MVASFFQSILFLSFTNFRLATLDLLIQTKQLHYLHMIRVTLYEIPYGGIETFQGQKKLYSPLAIEKFYESNFCKVLTFVLTCRTCKSKLLNEMKINYTFSAPKIYSRKRKFLQKHSQPSKFFNGIDENKTKLRGLSIFKCSNKQCCFVMKINSVKRINVVRPQRRFVDMFPF